jgi:hypothetical protein
VRELVVFVLDLWKALSERERGTVEPPRGR